MKSRAIGHKLIKIAFIISLKMFRTIFFIPQSKGFSRSICKALSKGGAPLPAPRRVVDRCNLQYLVIPIFKNTRKNGYF